MLGFIFLGIVISFLAGIAVGKWIKRNRKRYTTVTTARQRERMDNKTLIVPPTKPASDETQVLYFATGKGFVNAENFN